MTATTYKVKFVCGNEVVDEGEFDAPFRWGERVTVEKENIRREFVVLWVHWVTPKAPTVYLREIAR